MKIRTFAWLCSSIGTFTGSELQPMFQCPATLAAILLLIAVIYFSFNATNVRTFCCTDIHCSSKPTDRPIKFIKVQITNKSRKEIRQRESLMRENAARAERIYSTVGKGVKPKFVESLFYFEVV